MFALLFQRLYLPWYWDLENHPMQHYGYLLGLLASASLAIGGAVNSISQGQAQKSIPTLP
jgi:hypothetical protein